MLKAAATDGHRLARVTVPADLQPRLHPLVPAQQHSSSRGMNHERGRGAVQWHVAAPRPGGLETEYPRDIGAFERSTRRVRVERGEEVALRHARPVESDRKSTRLNSSHSLPSRMPSSA